MKKIQKIYSAIENAFSKLVHFLGKWNEAILFVVLFALWPFAVLFIRIVDPTAAVFDAGMLHSVYLTFMFFSAFHLFIWIGLKLNIGGVYDYLEDVFIYEFKNSITAWQRILLSFLYVSLYFLSVILTFMGIATMAG